MSLGETPSAERIHIGFFGRRNAGKSSLVNALTNQEMSVVSPVKGTTTDSVRKAMELLPLGPVVIIDTPGIDDEGLLGAKRVSAAKRVLSCCDIAVLCAEHGQMDQEERALAALFEKRGIPYLLAATKCDGETGFSDPAKCDEHTGLSDPAKGDGNTDLSDPAKDDGDADLSVRKGEDPKAWIATSALTGKGIEELKEALGGLLKDRPERMILADLVKAGETVVLVVPIDASAPKGRLILPQQLVLRELLDIGAMAFVTKETELARTLGQLKEPPALVVTDSQVFHLVKELVPTEIPLTSFSILMARYKGFLEAAYEGALLLEKLPDHAKILIAEGCTHHRQCEDIGTVKLPKLLKKFTGREQELHWSSGRSYPEDLASYDLVLHCGGCMLNEREMQYRMRAALDAGVPFTNYGIAIAHMNGILRRATAMLPGLDDT